MDWDLRSEKMFGAEGMRRLRSSRVAVFGLGGVGGYVAEALARAGVGALVLVDADKIELSNLNRQLYALHSTVGRYKTEVAKERIADINPACEVQTYRTFVLPGTVGEIDFTGLDYVADAIDTVAGKLAVVTEAKRRGIPVISAMGAGNKLDASAFEIADIFATSVCPLARVMRRELKKRGIGALDVVYSKEPPVPAEGTGEEGVCASNSFAPAAAGVILAGKIIKILAFSEKM